MFLGIEIGGTKLQLGIGQGDGSKFVAMERCDVDPSRGAPGILEQIERTAVGMLQKHPVQGAAYGFGGPINSQTGRVNTSHQIEGWDDFPLVDWTTRVLNTPTTLGNDCDCAALAEASFGAGQGKRTVFYITVGTGIGGGLVIDGQLHGAGRPAVAEIGHLRPGLHDDRPDSTVESISSGWGIAATARTRITGDISPPFESLRNAVPNRAETESFGSSYTSREQLHLRMADARQADDEFITDLLNRCDNDLDQLTTKMVGQAAAEGNEVAREVLDHSSQALGWAIAQVITLVAPEVIVVGGGVSLMGEQLFYGPLRRQIERYVFPPLAGSYQVVAPMFGELVVVHGAVALAAKMHDCRKPDA